MFNGRFWLASILTTLVCGAILQGVSITRLGFPAARPSIPMPGRAYVSATYDGQSDHSLFYFNFFGFGDRLRDARTLVIGSSHAEFGIDSATLGPKGFNMALGGGEGLAFATALLAKYRPHPSLVAVDSFAPDADLSTEATRTLVSTPAVSFLHVLNIWAGFLRDWLLQGLLPRLTVSLNAPAWEQPLRSVVVRDWQSADVTQMYSGNAGEVFTDASAGNPIISGREWRGMEPTASDIKAIREAGATVIVTTIPFPSFDERIGRKMADDLGGRFVHIDPVGLRLFDYHHLNAPSRAKATEILRRSSGSP